MEVISKTEQGVKASIVQAIIKVGSLNTAKARMNGTGCVDAQGRHYLPYRNFEVFLSKEFIGSSRKRIEKQLKQNIELFNLIDETRERLNIASLQSEFNSVAEENDQLSTEKTQLSIRCQELSAEKEQLSIDCQSTVNRLSSEAVEMRGEIDSLEGRCQEVSIEKEQLSIKHLATVNRLSSEAAEMRGEIDSYRASVNALSIEIDTLNNSVNALEIEVKEKEGIITSCQAIIKRHGQEGLVSKMRSPAAVIIVLVALTVLNVPFTGCAIMLGNIVELLPTWMLISVSVIGAIALESSAMILSIHGRKWAARISAIGTILIAMYAFGSLETMISWINPIGAKEIARTLNYNVLALLMGGLMIEFSNLLIQIFRAKKEENI